MMMAILTHFSAFVVGGTLGAVCMALVQVAHEDDRMDEEMARRGFMENNPPLPKRGDRE